MYEDGYVQVLSMEQSAQLDENEWGNIRKSLSTV
ncbi:hypothetical protein CIRMBP1307_02103 [Enterococcus cecorum]|nr:hypothetical protein CIRMBP1307_02103 [Enterococcus cecorum]